MKNRKIIHSVLAISFLLFSTARPCGSEENRLDYLASDQAYDRLTGTLVTEHTQWAKPLSGGRLRVFIIIQDRASRQVAELAQRLDMDYTVLVTAKADSFFETEHAGRHAVPRYALLIEELAKKRLHPTIDYDVILVSKIGWKVLPDFLRENILGRVMNGTGLVYIEAAGAEKQWGEEFTSPVDGADAAITAGLPLSAMSVVTVKDSSDGLEKLKELKGAHWHTQDGWRAGGWWTVGKSPATIKGWQYGKGRVLLIDYYEGSKQGTGILPSNAVTGLAGYDLLYALVGKACLWASGRQTQAGISLNSRQDEIMQRESLGTRGISFSVTASPELQVPLVTECRIRNLKGEVLARKTTKPAKISGKQEFNAALMYLPEGKYFADIWVKTEAGDILDFASLSFAVSTSEKITSVATKKDRYRPGEKAEGEVVLGQPLAEGQLLFLLVKDTWGRDILRKQLHPDGQKANFDFAVGEPLSALWDIQIMIEDKNGVVVSKTVNIGIPDYKIDNYFLSEFYGASPGAENILKMRYSWPLYGVNSANVRNVMWGGKYTEEQAALYGAAYESELAARNNLRIYSSVFPNGFGGSGQGYGSIPGEYGPINKNCLTNTDEAADPQIKEWKKWVDNDGAVTSRYGTIMNSICAESFLPLDVCFSKTCIAGFQDYLKSIYGDIGKLNSEYGTSYKNFSEVIPIPEPDVFLKKLYPMWLDHKMFMFSKIYTGIHRDVAKRLGTFHDAVRASTVDMWFVQPGYGVSPFDWPEMFKDVDSYQTEVHSFYQWEALMYEVANSLGGGRGLQVVRIDPWWYWETEHWKMRVHPWWNLFHGGQMTVFHGWGNGYEMAGGCHPLTSDWSGPLEWFKILTDGIKEIQAGIGPMIIQSQRLRDRSVAVVLSTVNVFASVLDPISEMNYDNNHRDFFVALQSMGITPEFIGEADMTSERIKKSGYRVILLPYNRAMSEELAAALREFVRNGGLLIAADKPGSLTAHCKEREKSVLSDLFPSFGKDYYSTKTGRGEALYVGNELMGMEGRINNRDFGALQGLKETIEKYAEPVFRVRLLDRYGVDRKDIFRSVFASGDTRYLCLLREPNVKEDDTGSSVTVVLPEKYCVYDVRSGSFLGCNDRLDITLPQYEGKVLALYTVSPAGLSLSLSENSISPGSTLGYRIEFKTPQARGVSSMGNATHLVVYGPDGKEMPCYTGNQIFTGILYGGRLPVALNTVPGRYRMEVRSIATGHRAEAYFDVKQAE